MSRRGVLVWWRYLLALLRQFRTTLLLAGVIYGLLPLLVMSRYVSPHGLRIGYWRAFHHVYFLLLDGPSLEYVDDPLIELVNLAVPLLGLAVLADGFTRFTALTLARKRNAREWITVVASTYSGHVVVCGAGRIGYRVATQLRELGDARRAPGRPEMHENRPFRGDRQAGRHRVVEDFESERQAVVPRPIHHEVETHESELHGHNPCKDSFHRRRTAE